MDGGTMEKGDPLLDRVLLDRPRGWCLIIDGYHRSDDCENNKLKTLQLRNIHIDKIQRKKDHSGKGVAGW